MAPDDPLIVRAELRTPDIVLVRHPGGQLTIIADTTIPDATVEFVAAAADRGANPGDGVSLS